jgi:hypothetical protein
VISPKYRKIIWYFSSFAAQHLEASRRPSNHEASVKPKRETSNDDTPYKIGRCWVMMLKAVV